MSWTLSLMLAVLCGAAGLLAAGLVASGLVVWYRVSSFEGGSGYFVVGIALLGLIAGAVLGLVVARLVAAGAHPGFWRAAGLSLGLIVSIAGTSAGLARLLADVPPEADGERLVMAIECRWPAAEQTNPAQWPGVGYVRLGSVSGKVMRRSQDGPLFLDQARREDGHWIAPGVVDLVTTRGKRTLDVGVGDQRLAGFLLPPAANENAPTAQWSEWLPHARAGEPPLPDQLSVRWRIQRVSQPVRTDRLGGFTIETTGGGFHRASEQAPFAAGTTMRVSHGSQALPGLERASAVAVLSGAPAALLALADDRQGDGQCRLVVDEGTAPRIVVLGPCAPSDALPITRDEARRRAARAPAAPGGWLDRRTFATPGLYLLGSAVLDTRTLVHQRTTEPQGPWRFNGLAPAALSPDEGSLAWFTHDGDEQHPALGVTHWREDRQEFVPIDSARMRYLDHAEIGPEWVDHHFEWVRGHDGREHLRARADFRPVPYRGRLEPMGSGGDLMYTLRPGGTALREAMVAVLAEQLHGERMPDELNGHHLVVRIDGKLVKAAANGGSVTFAMDFGSGDRALMEQVARTLDAAAGSGRHDALFRSDGS